MSLHALPTGTEPLENCLWANNQFVAISGNFVLNGSHAFTSPDGETWTDHSITAGKWAGYYRAFAYDVANDALCAIEVHSGSGTKRAIVSTDGGSTWNTYNLPSPGVSHSWMTLVANDTGRLVAVGSKFGGSFFSYSDDGGVTWSATADILSAVGNITGSCWNGSLFLLMNGNPGAGGKAYTSPDGVTWTEQTLPSDKFWLNPVWNGNVFIAGTDEASGAWIVSPDGASWVEYLYQGYPDKYHYWYSNAVAGSVIFSVGPNSADYMTPTCVFSFDDGRSWQPISIDEDSSYQFDWFAAAAHPDGSYVIALGNDIVPTGTAYALKIETQRARSFANHFLLMFT